MPPESLAAQHQEFLAEFGRAVLERKDIASFFRYAVESIAKAFDVEVGAVSFYAIDGMSHRFWHGAYPEEFDPEIAALATGEERTALRDAMRGLDRQLGHRVDDRFRQRSVGQLGERRGGSAQRATGDHAACHRPSDDP